MAPGAPPRRAGASLLLLLALAGAGASGGAEGARSLREAADGAACVDPDVAAAAGAADACPGTGPCGAGARLAGAALRGVLGGCACVEEAAVVLGAGGLDCGAWNAGTAANGLGHEDFRAAVARGLGFAASQVTLRWRRIAGQPDGVAVSVTPLAGARFSAGDLAALTAYLGGPTVAVEAFGELPASEPSFPARAAQSNELTGYQRADGGDEAQMGGEYLKTIVVSTKNEEPTLYAAYAGGSLCGLALLLAGAFYMYADRLLAGKLDKPKFKKAIEGENPEMPSGYWSNPQSLAPSMAGSQAGSLPPSAPPSERGSPEASRRASREGGLPMTPDTVHKQFADAMGELEEGEAGKGAVAMNMPLPPLDISPSSSESPSKATFDRASARAETREAADSFAKQLKGLQQESPPEAAPAARPAKLDPLSPSVTKYESAQSTGLPSPGGSGEEEISSKPPPARARRPDPPSPASSSSSY